LLRHSLDEQVLVYDARDDQVHLLDPTTACVMELLEEGGWTEPRIVPEVARRLRITPNDDLVTLALDQLSRADLLDKSSAAPSLLGDVNRREMVRKLAFTGAAALLVPAVATLTATRGYAQGGSRLTPAGGSCTWDGNCVSGNCCPTSTTCTADACKVDGTVCNPAVACDCCGNTCAQIGGVGFNVCQTL
jgi:PqqD family protein of HPr-rel-A system